MPFDSDKVMALRRLIDERFPTAPRRKRRVLPTGALQIDAVLGGGISSGTITEFVSTASSAGSQLTIGSLIVGARGSRQRVALVDAANAFSVDGLDDDAVAHLVWIRCGSLADAWRAADLVARDPNYSVVLIDVRGCNVRELMRTRDSIWVRLRRAAEQADTAVVVQTDSAVVPNAAVRLVFEQSLQDMALLQSRSVATQSIAAVLRRARTTREIAI